VLGESGVGKSSLALRFVSDEFQHYTDSTIGACYLSKSSEIVGTPIRIR
jgi:GTPase SAR1 family protein